MTSSKGLKSENGTRKLGAVSQHRGARNPHPKSGRGLVPSETCLSFKRGESAAGLPSAEGLDRVHIVFEGTTCG